MSRIMGARFVMKSPDDSPITHMCDFPGEPTLLHIVTEKGNQYFVDPVERRAIHLTVWNAPWFFLHDDGVPLAEYESLAEH